MGPEEYVQKLERENLLLKRMVVQTATIIKEFFEVLPDDLRTHENCKRALETSERLIDAYGYTIQAPRDRQ